MSTQAFSEPETRNLRDFVLTLDPVPVLSQEQSCFYIDDTVK